MLEERINLHPSKERLKAIKALEEAKKIERQVVFLPRGISGEHLQKRETANNQRSTKGIDRADVLKLYNEGNTAAQIAKALKVTRQTVYYHLNNLEI